MAKIFLTEAQRLEQRYKDLRVCIAERVKRGMDRSRLSQEKMAQTFSMGHGTVRKLTGGEDITLTTTKFLQLLDFAGLKIVDARKDAIQKEADR